MLTSNKKTNVTENTISDVAPSLNFQHIFNLTPNIIYLFDINKKKCLYHNNGFETILGYQYDDECLSADDPVGYLMHIEDFADYASKTFDDYRSLSDGDTLNRFIRLKHKNGTWHTFDCTDKVFECDSRGKPVSIQSFLHDVTYSRKDQQNFTHQKDYLATILHSIDDGVITTDNNGIIQSMNAAAEMLTGWKLRDAREHQLTDVFTIANKAVRPVEYGYSIPETAGRQLSRKQTVLISRTGTEYIIDEHISPIKSGDDSISGSVVIFRDVTDRYKFIESSLNNQKLDALGVLAGGIAHDFNNLLGGIYGYIDLAMLSNKAIDNNGYMTKAIATIDRARNLTRQLLTFAKGGAPVKKSINLFPVLKNSILLYLDNSKYSSRFSVAPDLWMSSVDIQLIEQAVNNIVNNAMDSMPDGGPITITAGNCTVNESSTLPVAPGRYVHLEIADKGDGIKADIIPYIFDPFFTTKSKGHGLGLASCHSIINRHGGCMDVTTCEKKGTTFHLYLPAVFEGGKKSQTPLNYHKLSGTVLLMDDEEIIRDITSRMLESLGLTVITTCEKHETIRKFKNQPTENFFSAVILDLTINGKMEGKEVADAIRKLDTDVPIFVSSGYAEDPVIAYPERYGFTGSIKKPFRITELKRILYEFCCNK